MSDSNPATGQPYGGRDEKPDDGPLPGERPSSGDEATVEPPDGSGGGGSRAASEPMDSSDTDSLQPGPGVPHQLHATSPDDVTDTESTEQDVVTQSGRTPDQ